MRCTVNRGSWQIDNISLIPDEIFHIMYAHLKFTLFFTGVVIHPVASELTGDPTERTQTKIRHPGFIR
jgi:hypothetical protein